MPFSPSISAKIAAHTGLSPEAASLVWTAGYDPWLIGHKKRTRYGIERPPLDLAERVLRKLRLREIYALAMPADPAQMYDGETIAERTCAAWPPGEA